MIETFFSCMEARENNCHSKQIQIALRGLDQPQHCPSQEKANR
jgi:hypothetical protein